ncbi:MAG: tetratricopeptide (TPR) repeat protein [Rhodothermales bacterium]|jgi:tetratricopeptide (TPR) repeat protein
MAKIPEIPKRTAAFLIAGLTLAVFANSLFNDFVNWDDPALVSENPAIKSLAPRNILAIFTPERGATYQPLRVLSYAIDHATWGLRPFGYHVMNTLLHGLAAWLLFLVLLELLPALRKPQKSDSLVGLTAALIFLVHPINVEAVVWISSRKYGLLAVFYLLAILLYLRGRIGPAFASGVAAALSSPFAFSLPFALLLIDYCRGCELRKYWRRYALFFLLCLAVLPLLMGSAGGELDVVKSHRGGFGLRVLSMWRVLFDSLTNALLPLRLNARYLDRASTGFEPKILLALAVTASLAFLAWQRLKTGDKRLLLGLGWFGLTWLPASNLVSISTMMADRYLYLPSIALWVALPMLLIRPQFMSWLKPAGIALLVALCVLTMQRNHVWRSSVSLWTDSLEKESANHVAHCSLGLAHYANAEFATAAPSLQRAFELDPTYLQTRLYLGHALDKLGRGAEAEPHYRWVLVKEPESLDLLVNLGIIRGKAGDLGEAERLLRQAIAVDAEFANAYSNLGNVLRLKGDADGALAAYRAAIRLKPEFAEVHFAMGTLFLSARQYAPAVAAFSATLTHVPNYPKAAEWLSVAQRGMQESPNAPNP